MNKSKSPLIVLLTGMLFFLSYCSENKIVQPDNNQDYFPLNSNILWKYSSNAISKDENNFLTFEMKIDSSQFRTGKFLALMGKRSIDTVWGRIFAIKDSGNTVYDIGDNPPETPFPLFKHKYDENEAVTEAITILGKQYNAKKVVISFSDSVKLKLWFVDGMGLVKEESQKGASIFSDEHFRQDFNVKTELIDFKELK